MISDSRIVQRLKSFRDRRLVAASGEIWQRLQDEKLTVSQSLIDNGRLYHDHAPGSDSEISDAVTHELDWWHRERLEKRLRQLTEAQDRLLEGQYGRCAECEGPIAPRRLEVDPAVEICFACQTIADLNRRYRSL